MHTATDDFWELLCDNLTVEEVAQRRKVREEFAKLHTRKLLAMRQTWDWNYDLDHMHVVDLLYEELNRREHVKNKIEAKAHRRALIKQGTTNRGSKRELRKTRRA